MSRFRPVYAPNALNLTQIQWLTDYYSYYQLLSIEYSKLDLKLIIDAHYVLLVIISEECIEWEEDLHRLKQCHSPAENSPYTVMASSNQVLREYWKYLGLLFKILPIFDSQSSDSCILRE